MKNTITTVETTKANVYNHLELICANSPDCYNYEIIAKDWENYGKSRTYYTIVCTDGARYHREAKYGYYDNIANVYVFSNFDVNAMSDYTFGGKNAF